MTKAEKEERKKTGDAIEKIFTNLIKYCMGPKNQIPWSVNTGVRMGNHTPSSKVLTVHPGYMFPKISFYFNRSYISYTVKCTTGPSYRWDGELHHYYSIEQNGMITNTDEFIYVTTTLFRNLIKLTNACKTIYEELPWAKFYFSGDVCLPNHLKYLADDHDWLRIPYTIFDYSFTCDDTDAIDTAIQVLTDRQYRRMINV